MFSHGKHLLSDIEHLTTRPPLRATAARLSSLRGPVVLRPQVTPSLPFRETLLEAVALRPGVAPGLPFIDAPMSDLG